MLITKDNFLILGARVVYWPESPESVYPHLSEAPVVTVMQCADGVAEALQPYAFRSRPFYTALIDLSQSEEDMWRGVQARTRSYINEARRMDAQILVNEDTNRAFDLINAFIKRKRFRPPIPQTQWEQLLERSDVFHIMHKDDVIASRVVLVDRPMRARLLLAATADRENAQYRNIIGPLHRYLIWHELNYYRARGMRWYDIGGVLPDGIAPASDGELNTIVQFKQLFGGTAVRENILRLAGNPVIRSVLREIIHARLALQSRGFLKRPIDFYPKSL